MSSSRLCVVGVLFASAVAGATHDSVDSLSSDLLRIHGELSHSTGNPLEELRREGAIAIERRAAALRDLIRKDPASALTVAFSPDVLAELSSAFPESAGQLESYVTWKGPVEQWVMDDAEHKASRTVTRLNRGEETFEIYFAEAEPFSLTSGTELEITGVRAGSLIAVSSSSVTSTSTLSCSTTGAQNTAVLLATYPGVTPPSNVTTAGTYDIFFGGSGRSLDGFWREASYGKTSATGNVFGWYTLDQAYTCSTMNLAGNAAIAAASADVNFQNYTRVFVVLPTNPGCGWSGLATMGCSLVNSPSGSFTASTTFLVPDDLGTRDRGVELVTHEAGHNLNLHHANWRDFGTEPLGPLGVSGDIGEYGDVFSTMGFWNTGQYSAPHKSQLNWMAAGTNYQVVQSSGSWSLQPLETNPAGLQALKIQRGTGNDDWLWVEYRQPIGNYDQNLATQVYSGALIHYEDSLTTNHTHLLDFTPETDTFVDPALVPGKTWTDPYSNVSITVQSATANALLVNVNYGAPVCSRANPSVTASPANPSTTAGSNVSYTVAITNHDSAACPAATLSLTSTQPSGWPTAFSAASITIAPGQTGSVTMTKAAPAGTPAGIYAVDTSATGGTFSGSGTANVTIMTTPVTTLGLSIPSSTYAVKQSVPVTARVSYGSAAAAGASVKFTVVGPGGTSTKTVAADSTGTAQWSYRIGAQGPTGIYMVTASTTWNSQMASASASFTVK